MAKSWQGLGPLYLRINVESWRRHAKQCSEPVLLTLANASWMHGASWGNVAIKLNDFDVYHMVGHPLFAEHSLHLIPQIGNRSPRLSKGAMAALLSTKVRQHVPGQYAVRLDGSGFSAFSSEAPD